MLDLEASQPPRQPGVGEGEGGGDGQQRLILFAVLGEGRLDTVKCLG